MSWSFAYFGKPDKLAEVIGTKETKAFSNATEQQAYDAAREMIIKTLAANTSGATLYVQASGHAGGGYCQSKVLVDSQPYYLQSAWTGVAAG